MNPIEALLKDIRTFNEQLTSGKAIRSVIEDNEAYILDMNTEDQLYENGVNNLGVSIAEYAPYRPLTIMIKRMKGQPTNRVTLRDTGDFHKSFYLVTDDKQFEIKASDWKAPDLEKKYGKQIFGLTADNVGEISQEYLLPELIKKLKSMING